MGNIPVTTTTKIFPDVLRYKWEVYCNTNGRGIAIQMGGLLTVFPFPQERWGTGSTDSQTLSLTTVGKKNPSCDVIEGREKVRSQIL